MLRDDVAPRGELMESLNPAVDVPARQTPRRPDGVLDAARLDIGDREDRNLFTDDIMELCRAYGPAGTVQQLLPLLQEACHYDDAAPSIAQAVGELGHFIAAAYENDAVTKLRPLLRALFLHVDLQVGSCAAKAAVDVVSSFRHAEDVPRVAPFIDLVVELAAGTAGISAKCAAACMLPAAHQACQRIAAESGSPEVSKAQARRCHKLRALFSELTRDSSAAVRRAAASALALWLGYNPAGEALADVMQWTKDLIRDRLQDSVRYAALPHLVSLARVGDAQILSGAQSLAVAAAKDISWRVRWMAARHMVPVMTAHPVTAAALLPSIAALAADEEVEVRSCVAQRLSALAPILTPEQVSAHLVPLARAFCNESNTSVRAAAAESVCDICRGATDADAKELLSTIGDLILDEADAVQLNVLRALPRLKERLNDPALTAQLTALLCRVSQVSESRWRVRERVAEQLRHLAQHMENDSGGAFERMLLSLIRDPVAAVRVTAMASLPQVAARFGARWTRQHIAHFAAELKTAEGFRERQLYVQVLEAMLPFASSTPGGVASINPALAASGGGNAGESPTRGPTAASAAAGSSPSPGGELTPGVASVNRSRAASKAPIDDDDNDASQSGLVTTEPMAGAGDAAVSLSSSAAGLGGQPPLSAFWRGVSDDIQGLARDRVSNVRLAVGHWLARPGADHIPRLAPLFAQLRAQLAADPNSEVRDVAAMPTEANPY